MTETSAPPRPRRPRQGDQPPTRARRRRSTLAIAAVIVGAQVALAAALAVGLDTTSLWASVAGRSPSHPAPTPIRTGDCVRAADHRTSSYAATPCSGRTATGTVLAVLAGSAGTEDCPQESDFFATRPEQVICLRHTGTDHLGDPGRGGGVYRRGDCVALEGAAGLREVACGAPTVFETVVDRVSAATQCRRPALRFAEIGHGRDRVLCLGDGPGLAATGECIGDPTRAPLTFDAIPCSDAAARTKVLARVATVAQCRSVTGTTRTVTDRSGLPGSTIVCLRSLR